MKSFDVVAETRRRWAAEERRQILAETRNEAVSVVARRHGVAASLVFRWRRQAGMSGKRSGARPSFVAVALPAPASAATAVVERCSSRGRDAGVIEIELAGGRRVLVNGTVDAEALKRVIAVLEGR
jgi:transposase